MDGTVIDVHVFTREGVEKDTRALAIKKAELERVRKDLADQLRILEDDVFQRVRGMIEGKVADGGPKKLSRGLRSTRRISRSLPRNSGSKFASRTRRPTRSWNRQGAPEGSAQDVRKALRREESASSRRAMICPGRAQDGQGLSGREAPRAAGRQDGRSSRQQGRDLLALCRSKTCPTWPTVRRWTSC